MTTDIQDTNSSIPVHDRRRYTAHASSSMAVRFLRTATDPQSDHSGTECDGDGHGFVWFRNETALQGCDRWGVAL